jgi:hypothetical protein
MFPYTAEEAEWLSAHADRHDWLLGQGDIAPAPATHANDDVAPHDRRSATRKQSRPPEDRSR